MSGSECVKPSAEGIDEKCKALIQTLYECKRGQVRFLSISLLCVNVARVCNVVRSRNVILFMNMLLEILQGKARTDGYFL